MIRTETVDEGRVGEPETDVPETDKPETDDRVDDRAGRGPGGTSGSESSGEVRLAGLAAVTGLLLVAFLAVHVTTVLSRDPESVDVLFLVDRWENPWWLFADWSFLLVGSVHACVAIWRRATRARPAGSAAGWRTGAAATLTAFVAALFLAASYAMMLLV